MSFVDQMIKEEPSMCQAVNELFADEINQMKLVIADKDSQLTNLGSQLTLMGSQLADKDILIAQLQAELEKYKNQAVN